jgi:hypothetical protein
MMPIRALKRCQSPRCASTRFLANQACSTTVARFKIETDEAMPR